MTGPSVSNEPDRAGNPGWFRHVLGHHPTGVAAITTVDTDGRPHGMAVSSFTSVSLDPPLVAFILDKTSSTWPRIEASGVFCVNVLAADQEHVCRALATKGSDKFAALSWRPAGTGSPMLDGSVAWIDCRLDGVTDAGDHRIVLGLVADLDITSTDAPLLFHRGRYGRPAPHPEPAR